jgi:transcriptional regulator with XRE-family HTH domain
LCGPENKAFLIGSLPLPHELLTRRKDRGWRQDDLAQRAGLSIPTLRSVERGGGSIAAAGAVAAALGLVWSWTPSATDAPGAALAQLRADARISQRAMARAIGVSQPTIIALEKHFKGGQANLIACCGVLGINTIYRDPSLPRRPLMPPKNESARDKVMTPTDLAGAIVARFAGQLDGTLLDPCRGESAFYDAFPDHCRRDWCEIEEGRDFFGWQQKADWIITNPPFSLFRGFLIHAMDVGDNIVFLAPISHFTTRARIGDIRQAGFGLRRIVTVPTPVGWPQSGFQLAAVHLKRGWRGPCAMEALGQGQTDRVAADDLAMFDDVLGENLEALGEPV